MARYIPLPDELRARSFDVREASARGVRPTRLLSSDLVAPFHGVRMHAAANYTLHSLCVAFAPRLRPGECFGGVTAASLWGIPLPSQWANLFNDDGTRHPELSGACLVNHP
ncbi:hypothetical protein [Lysinibacter cavernae]|uniref:Uncharacterized protein n=1 Tax=Lysinibacter cavernae TaxID=1640652 RepID=A0A7X5TSY9_9MICO|nr:hypothetical protein [Lysinibacter cavernae]NIH54051.1 hypothetical protein [Lysinibacter cavernae]